MKANLFKCFLPQAWMIGSPTGVSGFLHPEGVYDDPNGGSLRRLLYPRLKYHFQFQNQLMLFPIGHRERYSINVYENQTSGGSIAIANLFHPKTVDACYDSDGTGLCGGIKENDHWNLKGHRDRIVEVGEQELALFAKLYDPPGTPPLQARLPLVHSRNIVDVLRKFADQPRRLGDLQGEYYSTQMWNETNAERDHTMRRETRFPEHPGEWIVSGPHFYVGNPFYKTPRRVCTEKGHYDVIDLTEIPDDYLPRTNYVPDCDPEEYLRRTPRVPWGDRKPVTEFYRIFASRRLGPSGERTLQCAIITPGHAHIYTVFSLTFQRLEKLVLVAGLWSSIVYDFWVKSTGKSDFRNDLASQLPVVTSQQPLWRWQSTVTEGKLLQFFNKISLRCLIMNCLTLGYAQLWNAMWDPDFRSDRWSKQNPGLRKDFFPMLGPSLTRDCAVRTHYERRQALVEIDVLVAMALGLTLDELKTIYRVQFPVLKENEQDTWYDQKGRIVFTASKGLSGVGLSRPEWERIKNMKSGAVEQTIMDDTMPGGPRERTIVYYAPFDRCDRERDYETAWREFERR
jgi:hypothetical protein